MGSVSYQQAALLSNCDVQWARFDDLVTDNFLPLLPIEMVEGNCVSYPRVRDADKPTGIDFIASGGTIQDQPVGYGAQGDYDLKRIASRVTVAGDILTNVSQIHDVLEDQALAMAQLVVEKVGEQLWADTPSANAPLGMSHFAALNPTGVADPVQGVGKPLTVPDDFLCLRSGQSPWSPESRQYFVLHSQAYFEVLRQAWATGTNMVEFREDPHSGQVMAHMGDVAMVACDHISLDEGGSGTTSVYLVRVGSSDSDPKKIKGVSMTTSSEYPNVTIGSARSDSGQPDEYFAEVEWNVAYDGGSASAVKRTKGAKLQ